MKRLFWVARFAKEPWVAPPGSVKQQRVAYCRFVEGIEIPESATDWVRAEIEQAKIDAVKLRTQIES